MRRWFALAQCGSPSLSVHAGLLMMRLKPLELRDHDLARRDQWFAVLVGKGGGHEDLDETRIGSGFLGRIVGTSDDQALYHVSGVLDPLAGDAAAMGVAQEETGHLREWSGVDRHGDGAARDKEKKSSGHDRKSRTDGKLQSNTSLSVKHRSSRFVPATFQCRMQVCRFLPVSIFGHVLCLGLALHSAASPMNCDQRLDRTIRPTGYSQLSTIFTEHESRRDCARRGGS
jgi:hypothetical protein